MLSKLRTDIRQKLRNARLLLVNGRLFRDEELTGITGDIPSEKFSSALTKLSELGVEIFVYTGKKDNYDYGNKGNFNIWSGDSADLVEHLTKNGKGFSYRDTVSIVYSESDCIIMSNSVFSYTPASASIEAKMSSSYSSHTDGVDAFLEMCDLIVSANTYPYGFGE